MKKGKLIFASILILLIIATVIYISNINNFKREGTVQISKNTAPIQIHRDENGVPYVVAQNKADVIRGQGFVSAQDRLFQIEFYRALIKGELAEIIGSSMVQSDIKMRVFNLPQLAKNSFANLNKESVDFLTWYCEGFNEYLSTSSNEFPVELSLLGIQPSEIQPLDIMNIILFIGFTHGRDMEDEILTLNLAAKSTLDKNTFPLNINPDRTKPLLIDFNKINTALSEKLNVEPTKMTPTLLPLPEFGSNNWAVSGKKSASGKVIVCNDPHVDSRLLPGIFHPIGLSCPEFKSAGIAIPGIPGILGGRNEFVSFGITNGYGDSQDLCIEKTEGDFYFAGEEKLPIAKRKETIKVKDGEDVIIEVRSTVRGPIISDFDVFGIMTQDIVSLQWSLAYSKSKSIGFERFLESKNVSEFREALFGVDNMFFNFVFGDVEGNIAHQATGLIPKRVNSQGMIKESQTFDEFIPKDSMPHMINPEKNWVATANHDTRPDDYPFYYSEHFSPNYRYLRIKEVLGENRKFSKDELWQLILDCKSMQAERLAPIFVAALNKNDETKELGEILNNWNYVDDVNAQGGAVYNVLYEYLATLILNDELPDELEDTFWSSGYYWMQKLDDFIVTNHKVIDNITTPEIETLDDLIIQAGIMTTTYLTKEIGPNSKEWTWGKIHKIYFASPIRQEGFGKSLLGFEEFPKSGSNQTINRGMYKKTKDLNFDTGWFSSFRMVADLSDSEKFMGALAGGNSARIFHPYYKSQVEIWKNNTWIPYWISQEKVLENSKYKLILD